MDIAYEERDLNSIMERKSYVEKFDKHAAKLRQEKKVHFSSMQHLSFITYPIAQDLVALSDIVNRLSFALPQKDGMNIYIPVGSHLKDIPLSELITPDYQKRYIGQNNSFIFIDDSEIEQYLDQGVILIFDANTLEKPIIYSRADRVEIIDPSYFSHRESTTLRRLYYSTFSQDEKQEFKKISLINYKALIEKNRDKEEAYCFTTGPSFDLYEQNDINKNAFKIICNSIVKNEEFLNYIDGADLFIFADPVFHFGVSLYAEKFRKDMLNYVEKKSSYIIVPDFTVPLLLSLYPHLKPFIIGMPVKVDTSYNFPTVENFFVKNSSNILTLYMLPIASAISNKVFILGADGREKNEKYFWKHSKSVQYNSNMNDVFNVHPSFFRDRDYEDYYDEHCLNLENLLLDGEEKEKEYFSISPSYIPALNKRFSSKLTKDIFERCASFYENLIRSDNHI